MKLLLDTHVLLWAATAPDRLRVEARDAIESGTNEAFVSSVSAWEIAIKQSLGKLELAKPAEAWLPEVMRRTGFEPASIELASALRVRALPWHHRDPFDRLLIAQAFEGAYKIVTHDEVFETYGIPVLRA